MTAVQQRRACMEALRRMSHFCRWWREVESRLRSNDNVPGAFPIRVSTVAEPKRRTRRRHTADGTAMAMPPSMASTSGFVCKLVSKATGTALRNAHAWVLPPKHTRRHGGIARPTTRHVPESSTSQTDDDIRERPCARFFKPAVCCRENRIG